MDLNRHFLQTAASRRHGVVLEPVTVPVSPADLPGLRNVAVPSVPDVDAAPASGGIGRSLEVATTSAVGEALERYAGSLVTLETFERTNASLGLDEFSLFSFEQVADVDFPHVGLYRDEIPYTDSYDLLTNERVDVPACLVSLERSFGDVSTSSGLAVHPDASTALLRALQELIERDALMTTWVHGVEGQKVELDISYTKNVHQRGGQVFAIDATPAYSPHPVAIVLGSVPHRGRQRFTLGAACRATWSDALEKAYMEWAQGLTFIGDRLVRNPDRQISPADCTDFDAHALFYTFNPAVWAELPILRGPTLRRPTSDPALVGDESQTLLKLVSTLNEAGIRTLYRNMTTVDLKQMQLTAVRVLSPQLVPIHHNHGLPHLGGTSANLAMRYPNSKATVYPSPYPHPLG